MDSIHEDIGALRAAIAETEEHPNQTYPWYDLRQKAQVLIDEMTKPPPAPWDMWAPPRPVVCLGELGDGRCGRPATFIVWGKLYEKEELGPRCGECLAIDRRRRNRGEVNGNEAIYRIAEPDEEAKTPVQSSQPRRQFGKKPDAPAATYRLGELHVVPDFHRFAVCVHAYKVVVESRDGGVHTMSYRNFPPAKLARERASTRYPEAKIYRLKFGNVTGEAK